jgi:hypothetical protein
MPATGPLNTHHVADSLDGFDNGSVHGVRGDVTNESAVDLQEVDGQRLEIGERGHATAEVIEGDGRAEAPESCHQLRGAREIADGRGLGQLEADLWSWQSVLAQAATDVVRQARIADRGAGEIDHADRQPAAAGPQCRQLPACLRNDPAIHPRHQAVALPCRCR